METETQIFLLCRSKRRGLFPQTLLAITSQLKRTGNQSQHSFGGSHTPVPFAVLLLHSAEAEVTVPHPCPLPPVPIPLGQGHHILPQRQQSAQFRTCCWHQLQRARRRQESCSASVRTRLVHHFALLLTPTRPPALCRGPHSAVPRGAGWNLCLLFPSSLGFNTGRSPQSIPGRRAHCPFWFSCSSEFL